MSEFQNLLSLKLGDASGENRSVQVSAGGSKYTGNILQVASDFFIIRIELPVKGFAEDVGTPFETHVIRINAVTAFKV